MEKEKSHAELDELIDDSRRSFMKKGVLASSALALGVGTGAAAAESSGAQPSQTLMFAYDYYPGRSLQVVTRLQQSVTRGILGQETGDDGDAVVSDTSEWNTYLANYQMEGNAPGEYVLLFTRNGQLQQDDQPQLGTSATFFSNELNLLEVTVESSGNGGGDGGTPEDGTPTPEDGTPTPEEGTPTPEDGA